MKRFYRLNPAFDLKNWFVPWAVEFRLKILRSQDLNQVRMFLVVRSSVRRSVYLMGLYLSVQSSESLREMSWLFWTETFDWASLILCLSSEMEWDRSLFPPLPDLDTTTLSDL